METENSQNSPTDESNEESVERRIGTFRPLVRVGSHSFSVLGRTIEVGLDEKRYTFSEHELSFP